MLDPDICTQVLHAGATTLSYMPRGTVRIGMPSGGEGEKNGGGRRRGIFVGFSWGRGWRMWRSGRSTCVLSTRRSLMVYLRSINLLFI